MLIQCTKKLVDELKIVPGKPSDEEEPLLSWHANLLKIGRHKFIVLVNDANRYAIVLYGLKAKDKKNIEKLIVNAVREVFQAESIEEQIIDGYLQKSEALSFGKTKDRKLVARLNKACEWVHYGEDYWDPGEIVQVGMSKWISSLLVGDGNKDYIHPNEEMYKDLQEFSGQPIFNTEALVLKVTLKLDHHSVWRRITVPANITFTELHDIVQAAFAWQNSHLHDFEIYEKNEDGSVRQEYPNLRLVCDEAFSSESEIPVKMETGQKLKGVLPAKIIYNYDYGDNWKHTIEVERVIHDYTFNYPICEDGEGSVPPEDVGGQPGFDGFLDIINDPNHPDHEQMKEWGEMQGYEDFDLRDINMRLKRG
ncbi:plasmid pRiA4b ORF-3 family protein [Rossellomorea aquimaris]|uniref:plasmid pRiA4b ORF-3 family protein n=1 Tax=Rossellomorea aquimaris TaxID=189382 RepID=UPI0037C5FCFF